MGKDIRYNPDTVPHGLAKGPALLFRALSSHRKKEPSGMRKGGGRERGSHFPAILHILRQTANLSEVKTPLFLNRASVAKQVHLGEMHLHSAPRM